MHHKKELNAYLGVLVMSFIIIAIQLLGVYLSNSLALFADSGHVAADMLAVLVSVVVVLTINHQHEKEKKFRTIGGWVNVILLGTIGVAVLYEAYNRFVHPQEINSPILIITAFIGGVGNYMQYGFIKASKIDNITVKALEAHIKSDLLQSVGVVVGGVSILLFSTPVIDTLLSVLIGFLLLKWSVALSYKLARGEVMGSLCAHHNHKH